MPTNIWEFRLAIFWFLLFSLNALGTCILASLTGTKWAELDTQNRWMIFIAVFVNWSGTIMAFISKTSARVKKTGQIWTNEDGDTIETTPDAPK